MPGSLRDTLAAPKRLFRAQTSQHIVVLSPTGVAGLGVPACLCPGKILINTNKAFYSEAACSPLKEDAHLSKATVLGGKTPIWGKLSREGLYFGSKVDFWLHIPSSKVTKHVHMGMGCISHTLAYTGKSGTKRLKAVLQV